MRNWYHFTQRSVVRQILREGLRPRGDRPAIDHGIGPHGESLESNPNYVYLTSRILRPWHGMDYDEAALLVIDSDYLDEKLMRDDEDKARFGTAGTMAYEAVIHPDAVNEVWFYEPRTNENGVRSYVMIEQDFRDWEI
jgi:hypothetical protein